MLTAESLFLAHFTNRGFVKRKVTFAAPYPGRIMLIDLEVTEIGGEILCQKDAFSAALGTKCQHRLHRFHGIPLAPRRWRGDPVNLFNCWAAKAPHSICIYSMRTMCHSRQRSSA